MLNVDIEHKCFQSDETVIGKLRFAVEKNEIVALIGPSGAGKSTLLNLIAGLDTQFEGSISSDNEDPPKIGLMFQEARLMPWLTVLENVLLVADPHCETKAAEQQAKEILHLVGMDGYLSAFPAQLSGGMTKRVALARAFMFKPSVLLMDEPFASLDAPSAEKLRHQLITLQQQMGSSIVYVTHDLKEAVAIADRILFLSPKPMSLLSEERILLGRPRYTHDPEVAEICQLFYQRFPALLCAEAKNTQSL